MALNRRVYRYSAAHSHFLTLFFASLGKFRVPDITGRFSVDIEGHSRFGVNSFSGAFRGIGPYSVKAPQGEVIQVDATGVEIKASSVSAVHGKSNTVQNNALRLLAIIKV